MKFKSSVEFSKAVRWNASVSSTPIAADFAVS